MYCTKQWNFEIISENMFFLRTIIKCFPPLTTKLFTPLSVQRVGFVTATTNQLETRIKIQWHHVDQQNVQLILVGYGLTINLVSHSFWYSLLLALYPAIFFSKGKRGRGRAPHTPIPLIRHCEVYWDLSADMPWSCCV